eukprot:284815478_6
MQQEESAATPAPVSKGDIGRGGRSIVSLGGLGISIAQNKKIFLGVMSVPVKSASSSSTRGTTASSVLQICPRKPLRKFWALYSELAKLSVYSSLAISKSPAVGCTFLSYNSLTLLKFKPSALCLFRDTRVSKGYAFITYTDRATAEKAISKLDRHGHDSLLLRVRYVQHMHAIVVLLQLNECLGRPSLLLPRVVLKCFHCFTIVSTQVEWAKPSSKSR